MPGMPAAVCFASLNSVLAGVGYNVLLYLYESSKWVRSRRDVPSFYLPQPLSAIAGIGITPYAYCEEMLET